METKLLYVKAITLLYRESELLNNTNRSYDLVKSVLALVKPLGGFVADVGKDVLDALRETINWMVQQPDDTVFDRSELLQRLMVNSGRDMSLYEAVKHGIEAELEEPAIKRICKNARQALGEYTVKCSVRQLIREASITLEFREDEVEWNHFVTDHIEKLQPFTKMETGKKKHQGLVSDFNLSDVAAVQEAFDQARNELSTDGIITFGLQAINRMFGDQMGGRRGEMLLLTAMPNCYKSGMCLDLMKWMALYNKPFMRDPTKKPMILRISFEDPVTKDIGILYKTMKEFETGHLVDMSVVDSAEAQAYVVGKLEATGYNVRMVHIDPTDFTCRDLIDFLNDIEAEGYEIHGLFIDYLEKVSKRGLAQGPAGVDMRDLFKRVRNYTAPRGIFCCTPHQLSTAAKHLLRMHGHENLVQELAGKGYYEGCSSLDAEVDIEFILHRIQMPGDEFYLAIQRGKHRKNGYTQQRDLYFLVRFNPIGGIRDDLHGKDSSQRKIGASTAGEGGAEAWHHQLAA